MKTYCQPFRLCEVLGVPVDHPPLVVALAREEHACPITNMCLPPSGPVYLVSFGGKPTLIRQAGLNGQKLRKVTRRAVLEVLELSLKDISNDSFNSHRLKQRERVRRAV